ncbi:MAG TPA: hypothetical protein PKK96_04765 [Anaerolineales bacterium]|nr:hypothetical protein [Anaerolineales bacterium]HNQ93583.1 hypothetical protein [Anaerolineales bacterium]HNS60294.1 hypothetical protein [Anaerolineales bacterium]
MEQAELAIAAERLARLSADFHVAVLRDWGSGEETPDGAWQNGLWSLAELDRLHDSISLLANSFGGSESFLNKVGSVTVKKGEIGSHGGEALHGRITLSSASSFNAWTVVHEFAHIWDENSGWQLSRQLERYTGGYTSRFFSWVKKYLRLADLNGFTKAEEPGKRGRKPGCNARGYFYGDKPSGSNYSFNRVEDFAESVAMYVGWGNDNALSDQARARISRYELADGEVDPFFRTKDNWAEYAKYFDPEGGDYSKTKRWRFVEHEMTRGI